MKPDLDSPKPLFAGIAQWLEDAILAGTYGEDQQVPSTTEISVRYKINPATALKGINRLVDAGILHKKRGLGMFVAPGARAKLLVTRRGQFYEDFVGPLVKEAKHLEIAKPELQNLIERGYEN